MKKKLLTLGLSLVFTFTTITSAFAGTWSQNDMGQWKYRVNAQKMLLGYYIESSYDATSQWVNDNGKLYCFDSNGIMYANTYTPDGYWVGADGAWVETEPRKEWPVDANGNDIEIMRSGESLVTVDEHTYELIMEANHMFDYNTNKVAVKDYVYATHIRFYNANGSLCCPNDGIGAKNAVQTELVLTRVPIARDQAGQMEIVYSWGLKPYQYDLNNYTYGYVTKAGHKLLINTSNTNESFSDYYTYDLLTGVIEFVESTKTKYWSEITNAVYNGVNAGYSAMVRGEYDYIDQLYYGSEYLDTGNGYKYEFVVRDFGNNIVRMGVSDSKAMSRLEAFQKRYTKYKSYEDDIQIAIDGDDVVYSSYRCVDENMRDIKMVQRYDKRTGKFKSEQIYK